MSALPPKADMLSVKIDVCFVPQPDILRLPPAPTSHAAEVRNSAPVSTSRQEDLQLADKLASNFHSCFSPRTSRIVGTLPVKRLECQVLSGTPSLLSGLNSGRSQHEAINDPQSFSRPWNSRRTNDAIGDLSKAWRRRSWSWGSRRWSPYACWGTRSWRAWSRAWRSWSAK